MKQRIRVVAIIRREGEVLALKRSAGRADSDPEFELPTSKILIGEQPEEAAARAIYEYLNEEIESVSLVDVFTFADLPGSSRVENLFIVYEVSLKGDSVKITTSRYSEYRWIKDGEYPTIALDAPSRTVINLLTDRHMQLSRGGSHADTKSAVQIFTDGGSRGNPGPSGIGYYIIDANGQVLKRGGEFLGFSSSRLAEYYGLKEGVEQAIELGLKTARFMSDSLMMVNQMNGVYPVKNNDLKTIYEDIWTLLGKLDSYSFEFVPRTQNTEADSEANRVIDKNVV